MRLTKTRMLLATVTALALMVGVGTAFAASGTGPTLKEQAAQIAGRTTFDAAVASNLGTTTAKLNAAIKAAATARINTALAADEITSDEATTLKELSRTGRSRRRASRRQPVAKELGTTEAKLNAAYATLRRRRRSHVSTPLQGRKITDTYAANAKDADQRRDLPGLRRRSRRRPSRPRRSRWAWAWASASARRRARARRSSGSSSSSATPSSLVFA